MSECYYKQHDLLDSEEFALTSANMEDPEKALKRELDRRSSDCLTKQTQMLNRDTRMIDGAMGLNGFCVEDRAVNYGLNALSDREILTLFIDVDKADKLLDMAGNFMGLARWTVDQITSSIEVSTREAVRLASVFQIHQRANDSETYQIHFDRAEKFHRNLMPITRCLEVEKFWVFCLDRKNRLIRRVEITSGTATSTLVHPREVYRPAIQTSATAIVVVHNHPSGDPAPSRADIQVTKTLVEASKSIGIDFLDHIVIGERSRDPLSIGFYSFNNAGLV